MLKCNIKTNIYSTDIVKFKRKHVGINTITILHNNSSILLICSVPELLTAKNKQYYSTYDLL